MKHNFQITFENSENPPIQNISFYGSVLQASRVFYALSFALCFSTYDALTLFCGEKECLKCNFNHRDQIPTFTKVR